MAYEELIPSIQTLSKEISEKVRTFRRHIHAHPELSFEEHETCKYVSQQLRRNGN